MRFFKTLHFRIPALVFLVGALLIWLGYSRNVRWRVDRRMEALRVDAHADGTRLSGMAQHLFRKKLLGTADLEMSYASATPELDLGFICDGKGVVRHSTRLQWRGVPLEKTPLKLVEPWMRDVRDSMTGRVVEDLEKGTLTALYPFREATGDSIGVVVLRYDLAGPAAVARHKALHETVPQGLGLLAGCLLIWGALHVLVTSRVDELLDFGRAISAGRVPEPLALGDDELGVVGRAMADAVEKIINTEKLLLEAGEMERRRVGRDLHDDVCQRITAAQLKAGLIGAAVAGKDPTVAKMAGEIEAELSTTAQVARGFARGLAPVALDVDGIDETLMELGAYLERSFSIRCTVDCSAETGSLSASVCTHLYRIAQELATNAAKHARGTFVFIGLSRGRGEIRLEVENDGVPFVDNHGKGLGLHFVRQRVRALGGTLYIGRRPGGASGTLAVCQIPLDHPPHSTPNHPTPNTP